MGTVFTLLHTDGSTGRARAGVLALARGEVRTPVFAPVGTRAAVKGLTAEHLESLGAELVLANAWHLGLRPGDDLIASLGGLHRFMGWRRPVLTDSGGYQVFSLAAMREVSDDGVLFVSPVDGARHFLTPERSMEAQHRLGADVIMMFDECARHPCPEPAAREAMRRTHAWAARCQARHRALCAAPPRPGAPQPLLFGIVQGATFLHLRRESAEAIVALDLPGHAIGGLSVGESWSQTAEVIEATAALLPADRPRYLMGVGRPEDVLRAVALGIDMFDCVLPTRGGRHGVAYTRRGLVRIRNREHAAADRPLDETCACPTCARHSRAYLRHLFHEGEGLAATLLTLHNVHFFLHMMRQAREAILADRFAAFAGDLLREIAAGDHA